MPSAWSAFAHAEWSDEECFLHVRCALLPRARSIPQRAFQVSHLSEPADMKIPAGIKAVSPPYRVVLRSSFAALALGAAAFSAHALTLNIDANQSSVTYTPGGSILCDPDGNCGTLPEPQSFALSGSVDVVEEVVPITVWFDPLTTISERRMRFESITVDSGGATALGFVFPSYFAVVNGTDFAGSEDGCTSLVSTGSCSSTGTLDRFEGSFDGTVLLMRGSDAFADFFSSRTFSFELVARVAEVTSVPEPGTLACLVLGALGLGAMPRKKHRPA